MRKKTKKEQFHTELLFNFKHVIALLTQTEGAGARTAIGHIHIDSIMDGLCNGHHKEPSPFNFVLTFNLSIAMPPITKSAVLRADCVMYPGMPARGATKLPVINASYK